MPGSSNNSDFFSELLPNEVTLSNGKSINFTDEMKTELFENLF